MDAEGDLSEAVRAFLSTLSQGPLSSPTRLAIMLTLLLRGQATFSEIQGLLDLTPGNLGAHLERLETEGYVRRFRCLRGLRYVTCYRPTEKGAEAAGRILRSASELWNLLDELDKARD